MKSTCSICPHACALEEGQKGLCRARVQRGGKVECENYGRVTSMALDPIEKKPFARFHPGSTVLSVGSYGCNLKCPFCQNSDIAAASADDVSFRTVPPEQLADTALALLPRGNIGVAYTYNEPMVGFEYVLESSKTVRARGMKNAAVTNGMICEEPLMELLPYMDAMNIDLKSFSPDVYRKRLGGELETVKNTICLAAQACHVEVTALIVPGMNDSTEEMDLLSGWLADVGPDIPLHITRFFPRYRMTDARPTGIAVLDGLCAAARKHLRYVYRGNC
ncbi:MAG TPA: AmmeMemoRadiSam system radical SAM enzyme [Clostridiales bacterium]|nr:MAG: Pyruvate formate-lyase 1-activating enzyme [Firmicutes bacterium ADurb.Bin262]HOU09343.1 AmmeMemoRadiSam system radical SAM enzyme [Clostridiales bacterium]HQH63501.1 AmmeMemoRadiSam system radical SAM enzyme [Clostridiales bacterium]HQK74307.1 AmmeMemoRadiSam system radical SAM enzyme [Clostridiales bacterium]